MQPILGIDIGGSGIKAAPVDVATGTFTAERVRMATPSPSTPQHVADVVREVAQQFAYHGPVGITFPAVVKRGHTMTAANVDDAWIGTDAQTLFEDTLGMPVTVMNDADAAGVAEFNFGAGQDQRGTVIMLTFGTGIGSAIFRDGLLLPNTEFGHMELRGRDAEHYASALVREQKQMSWKKWGRRVNRFLLKMEFLFWPDLFILGGGVSRRYDRFAHHLTLETPVVPAQLLNDAGIVGAALVAAKRQAHIDTRGLEPVDGPPESLE